MKEKNDTYQVVDNIKFVIVIVLWIHFLVVSLTHMIHQSVTVAEPFFAINTFIAAKKL